NVRESAVIEARDVDNIYGVPEAYHAAGLDTEVLSAFGIEPRGMPDLATWRLINERIRNPEGAVTIAVVGKYTGLKDAYKSLIEALSHGGIANKVKVNLDWIESEVFEREDPAPFLEHVNGILVPGGFGQRGSEGKIRAVQFARERQLPYFGICFGMQMAVIEAARNLCGIENANSTDVAGPFAARNDRVPGPSMVHRSAVSSRAQIAALRATSAVRLLCGRCGRSEPPGVVVQARGQHDLRIADLSLRGRTFAGFVEA